MKNVYLSILHLTEQDVKFHSKKTVTLSLDFLPVSPSPTILFVRLVGLVGIPTVSQSSSVFGHLVFKKKSFFPGFFLSFRISPPSFQFTRILTSTEAYCGTYREDEGNRLPLCEGEVDFICQVSNLICYQLLIILLTYQ
jgi:hypothetical protein